MKIYKVSARWATKLVLAKSIPEAVEKYKKSVQKIIKSDPEMCEITSIDLLGDAL